MGWISLRTAWMWRRRERRWWSMASATTRVSPAGGVGGGERIRQRERERVNRPVGEGVRRVKR
jgi:hypothetical protein